MARAAELTAPSMLPSVMPGLVWAFRIHADGVPEPLAVDAPIDMHHDGWLWLNFNLADTRACDLLTQFSDLPPAATRVLLAPDGHQQLHVEPTCIYGIFADLIYGLDGATREIGFLHFALTERALISARRHAMTAAEGARQALLGGSKLTSVAALLEMIVEQVIASINSCADQLAEEMDAIEVELLSQKVSDQRTRLTRIRKAAVYLHRQLTGLNSLFQRCGRELDSDARPHLRVPTGVLAAAPSGD